MDTVYAIEGGAGTYNGKPRKKVIIVDSGEIPMSKWNEESWPVTADLKVSILMEPSDFNRGGLVAAIRVGKGSWDADLCAGNAVSVIVVLLTLYTLYTCFDLYGFFCKISVLAGWTYS